MAAEFQNQITVRPHLIETAVRLTQSRKIITSERRHGHGDTKPSPSSDGEKEDEVWVVLSLQFCSRNNSLLFDDSSGND
jgi:hypothetical protein